MAVRTFVTVFAALIVCAAAGKVGGITGLNFVGRIDNLEGPTNIHLDWPSVELDLSFTINTAPGSVSLVLTDEGNVYAVWLDDAVAPTIVTTSNAGTSQPYVLASGISAGAHTLKIVKRTEPLVGMVIFHGFTFNGGAGEEDFVDAEECWALHAEGAMVSAKAVSAGLMAAQPQLEFYGDSITCGYGNEGVPPCSFSAATENNYLAYGPVTARAVGATVHVESWSGKGVVRNYGSPNVTSPQPMPSYWNQSTANNPTSRWNFARFVPNVITINLGTNDFSTQPNPPNDLFQAGYNALIDDIMTSYAPATPALVLVCGPMYTVPAHCENVQAVATQNNATYVDMNGILGSNDYGCDGHPSVSGHAKMAAMLTPIIQKLL